MYNENSIIYIINKLKVYLGKGKALHNARKSSEYFQQDHRRFRKPQVEPKYTYKLNFIYKGGVNYNKF